MEKRIYVDHAATTKTAPEVIAAMLPYFETAYGNPSSIYQEGREAKKAIETAREEVAGAIGAEPREIFFTGSGSEADNWAIRSAAKAMRKKGNHIITTAVEHHAVLHTCQQLEKEGFEVTYLPVDEYGMVSPSAVQDALRETTTLVTIMLANNEIGTIMPVQEIAAIVHNAGALMHTDAVQAIGMIPVDVKELKVDMLSLTGHKFHGPKGSGALFVRSGLKLEPFITGGAQERGRRAGTENVPGIVGLGKAISLATANIPEKAAYLTMLRDSYINKILQAVPFARLNGHPEKRLPGNANFSFSFIEGEGLLLFLDMKGISASSGSACTSGSLDPSHVLLAIGLKHEEAHGSLRVTFDMENTMDEVDVIVEAVRETVERLRNMSPLYEKYLKEQQDL